MAIATVRITRAAAVFFGAVGGYCVVAGLNLRYYGVLGPGPGFFPVWIGALLFLLSALLIVQSFRSVSMGEDADTFFASAGDARRVVAFVLSFIAVWLLLDRLGFRIAIFIFALFAPRIIGPQPPLRTVALALFCSFGVAYGFESWLKVQLPGPMIGFLDDIGL